MLLIHVNVYPLLHSLGQGQFGVISTGRVRRLWQECYQVDLYLRHDLTDFDQTWSQVPVDHPIYVIWPDRRHRSRRGQLGQKGQKLKNATPPTDNRVWSRYSCICICLTPSTKFIQSHLESQGSKGHFTKNAIIRPCYIAWP